MSQLDPVVARQFAVKHLLRLVVLEALMCASHAAALAGVGLFSAGVSPEWAAKLPSLPLLGTASLFGLVWTAANAWGLWHRKAWARRSAMVHAVISGSWCCCLPLPLYLFWALRRPELRALFQERRR